MSAGRVTPPLRPIRRSAAALALTLLLASPLDGQGHAPYLAAARAPWSRWPDFSAVVDAVARVYALRSEAPVWLDQGRPSGQAREAITELRDAGTHGLRPDDYDAAQIDSLASRLDERNRTRFDLMLTVGFVRYVRDLSAGRAPSASLGGRIPSSPVDLAAAVASAVAGDSVKRLATSMAPGLAQYRNLRQGLARYRALADSTLPPVPPAVRVRPGDPYDGAGALARRLAVLGDLPGDAAAPTEARYAGDLVEAVRRFQRRHGLPADGVLGAHTFAALQVPMSRRVRQIELALDRLRSLPPFGGGRLIVVNIPAFHLFAFDSVGGTGVPALGMRVIVGKALNTRTPVLLAQLRYLEFQPYWNVPRSILVNEVLPVLRRRPAYLREHGMELIGPGDRILGDRVTPDGLARLAAGELRVRQRPSGRNPLGRVKFVLPNAADVYLHGTPDTALFSQGRRDFSHGCIRVQAPDALASWVLRDLPPWPADSVAAAMAGTRTRRVLLSRPMPVVLFYTTAVAMGDGTMAFYEDIYGHDRRLDEALRAGPTGP